MATMSELDAIRKKRAERENRIVSDIVDECRTQLMLKFRFLDMALWRMPLEPCRDGLRYALACDAEKIYLDPPRMIARFNSSYEDAIRDYLHMIMHCVFRHPFEKSFKNRDAWWLACDVLVESVVLDMCADRFACPQDKERREALSELSMCCGKLLPAKLYHFFDDALRAPEGSTIGISRSRLIELQDLFERDSHEAWPAAAHGDAQGEETPGEAQELAEQKPDSDDSKMRPDAPADGDDMEQRLQDIQHLEDDSLLESEDDGTEAADGGDEEASSDSNDGERMGEGSPESEPEQDEAAQREAERERKEHDEKLEKDWEELSKEIEMGLETFSQEWGDEAGSFISKLRIANRKVYDYTDFLKRFTYANESLKMNPDEFDYIYYTYGMNLYGNIPLIEPLEYKETNIIRDFVIAIDTSRSTSGELVRKFLEHTFSVLKKSEAYSKEVNIHIVQCDSKVQADTKIENLKDIDAIMEDFAIRGYGGTDFRPLFAYVERLRNRGELSDLKGLLYFTDGIGQFPDAMPEYEVAFVFMDDGDRVLPPVPPWAMKVVMDEQGINALKSENID